MAYNINRQNIYRTLWTSKLSIKRKWSQEINGGDDKYEYGWIHVTFLAKRTDGCIS